MGLWVSVHPSDLAPVWIVLSLTPRGLPFVVLFEYPSSRYGSTPLFRAISSFRSSFSVIDLNSLNLGLVRLAICLHSEVMCCLHVLDTFLANSLSLPKARYAFEVLSDSTRSIQMPSMGILAAFRAVLLKMAVPSAILSPHPGPASFKHGVLHAGANSGSAASLSHIHVFTASEQIAGLSPSKLSSAYFDICDRYSQPHLALTFLVHLVSDSPVQSVSPGASDVESLSFVGSIISTGTAKSTSRNSGVSGTLWYSGQTFRAVSSDTFRRGSPLLNETTISQRMQGTERPNSSKIMCAVVTLQKSLILRLAITRDFPRLPGLITSNAHFHLFIILPRMLSAR